LKTTYVLKMILNFEMRFNPKMSLRPMLTHFFGKSEAKELPQKYVGFGILKRGIYMLVLKDAMQE